MSDLPDLFVASDETPEWMADAACRGMDVEFFFPQQGDSVRDQKAVCRTCPVAAECLAYAMELPLCSGIWGGLSERERRRLRVGVRKPSTRWPHDCAPCGTEAGYSKHRRRGEQACADCLYAHAEAGRAARARQKARRLAVVPS